MNGLRGLAALIVVIFHGGWGWFGVLRPPGAYLAVDLFFVLSGFVIAYSYEARFASGMTVRQFFVVRMIRFYPLYILGTALSVLLLVMKICYQGAQLVEYKIVDVPFALAMLPSLPSPRFNPPPMGLYPLNGPAWSLFAEMIANLVYAASYRYWSIKNILIAMFISAALMLSTDWFAVGEGWGAGGAYWPSFPFALFRVFYAFPAGVLIYRITHERRLQFPQINTWAILALFPFLLMWNTGLMCRISMLVGIPLLVAVAAKSEPIGMLKSLCAVLGGASYAIYAVHWPLINLTVAAVASFGFDRSSHIIGFVFIVAITPMCLLIDKWYDIPIRRVLSRVFVRDERLQRRIHEEANVEASMAADKERLILKAR